jgi:hypothetical protein
MFIATEPSVPPGVPAIDAEEVRLRTNIFDEAPLTTAMAIDADVDVVLV